MTSRSDRPKPCSVDECPDKHYARGWCRTHYRRWWETGNHLLAPRPVVEKRLNNNGYVLLHRPGHPLATSPGGRGLEHRIVVFDVIGDGEHPCSYCTTPVTWGVNLEIDHADANPTNNDLSNLRVCCGPCNKAKANRRRWHGDLEATA